MSIARAAILFLLFAAPSLACAATTSTVVDLPSTDGLRTLRILHVRPDTPIGTIVGFAGGNGVYSIQDSGAILRAIEAYDGWHGVHFTINRKNAAGAAI